MNNVTEYNLKQNKYSCWVHILISLYVAQQNCSDNNKLNQNIQSRLLVLLYINNNKICIIGSGQ